MKVYLVNDISLISKMKRLIRLKADLGLCVWSNDFSDCKFSIQDLIDATDAKLDAIKDNSVVLKEFSDDEDMEFFETVNSNVMVGKLLDSGIVDFETKAALGEQFPALLVDVSDKVSDTCFIWIV